MPAVGDVLDGAALLRWGQGCLHALERHRDEINALNVFPVADSDTGTNLFSTMRAAVRAAESSPPTGPAAATGQRPTRLWARPRQLWQVGAPNGIPAS